jgi:hypothetical protein
MRDIPAAQVLEAVERAVAAVGSSDSATTV